MRARALTATLAATTAALAMTACGGDTDAVSTPGGSQPPSSVQAPDHNQAGNHNQADITFAQAMIPHHAQAVEMAQMAQERAQSPQVKDLARRIEQAQGPEIETMTTWLEAWNAPVPPTGQTSPGHGDMRPMPGMMDPQQMGQLGHATGAEFDRQFLQMMIMHHEGAIAMARTELANGQNPEAKRLAQQIIDAQQTEIQEMRKLLSQG